MIMKIENSKEDSVNGKWSDPGAALYDKLMKEDNWKSLINEAYLIHSDVDRDTSFSAAECKYPHHVIHDGKLVLHRRGIQAAYARAKQMKVFHGDLKKHIEKHYRELDQNLKESVDMNKFQLESFLSLREMEKIGKNVDMKEYEEELNIDENANEVLEGEVYVEGWKEIARKAKEFIKTRLRMLRGLPRVPKSPFGFSVIHNIIAKMRTIKGAGFPIFGVNMIVVNQNGDAKLESTDNFQEKFTLNNISKKIFLEATNNQNTVISWIKEFLEDYPVPSVIVKKDGIISSQLAAVYGIGVMMLDNSQIDSLKKTGDCKPPMIDSKAKKPILLIAPQHIIPQYSQSKNNLFTLLRHEYGHVKTMRQVSERDFLDYIFKSTIIRNIQMLKIVISRNEAIELLGVANAVYWQLKPEKLANDYMKLDFQDILKILNFNVPANWDKHVFNNLINLKVPDEILDILKKNANLVAIGGSFNLNDIKKSAEYSIHVYETCTPDIIKIPAVNSIKDYLKTI